MIFPKIKYYTFALIVGMVMVCGGCRLQEDPCPPEEPAVAAETSSQNMVNLCLNVSFDGQQASTRADKNDDDGYEVPKEDFEQISTLRVIIVHAEVETDEKGDTIKVDGHPRLIGTKVEANRMVNTTVNGYPDYDNLEFEVSANDYKKIFLIANESSLQAPEGYNSASQFLKSYEVDSNADLNMLRNWTVSIPGLNSIDKDVTQLGLFSDSKALRPMLPMTEYFDVYVYRPKAIYEIDDSETTKDDSYIDKSQIIDNVITLDVDSIDDLCTANLFMTRAAAKATFYLDTAELNELYKDTYITSLSLTGIGSEEYVFPNDAIYSKGTTAWNKENIVASSNLEMYISSFKTPTASRTVTYLVDNLSCQLDNATGTSITLTPETSITGKKIAGPIYFPESILAEGKNYTVKVTLNTGIELEAPLVTNILSINRDDKDHDAIARNTHLKITLGFPGHDLPCVVTVYPYTGVFLNPEFGFSAPVSDKLIVATTMDLVLNGDDGLLYPTFTSTNGNTIQNLYWVSSDPSIVLLSNEVTEEDDQRYVEPSESIELSYLQMVNDEEKPVPVRIIPKGVGKTYVTAYTQSGLVARCLVSVSN
ncbi:MAG: hypothetical protein K2N35_06705 [Muribaculaceae bacterium]|nr:hypothetical protein [Muribaculaceae bacterium]